MKLTSKPMIAPLWEKVNVTLSFEKANIRLVEELFASLEENIDYDIKIAKKRNKRSKDANAYAWVLLGMLATKLGITPMEVYKEQVKEMPTYTMLCVQEEAVNDFIRRWTAGHDGRAVEVMASKIYGCVNLKCFYGTSDFNSLEMSQFIDHLLYECDLNGIAVEDREEINKAKKEW